MNQRTKLLAALFGICILAYTSFADEAGERLFAIKVLPLLKAKCVACHGENRDDLKGEFDLTSRKLLLAGGESGEPAVVPGKPAESPLMAAIKWKDGLEMPPKENDRLTKDEIAHVERWIASGAPWPSDEKIKTLVAQGWEGAGADGVKVTTSGGLSDDWTNRRYQPEDLWAYQPLTKPEVPVSYLSSDQAINAVDAFINRRLSKAKLKRAELSDTHTFVRRATIDLTGLPPDEAMFANWNYVPLSIRGRIELVDELLNRPQYGERMARHWLDVARYADTAGFANDYARPHAWRYRDYVIRAFNNDMPYDQFVREQIAGDILGSPEQQIAVGYLRMGPWEHTGMSVAAVTRQQWLDDVTNSVGVTFLATGMSCFKCHDHKFDPLPTRDYYRMQAVFAGSTFKDRELAFLADENLTGMKEYKERLQRLLKDPGLKLMTAADASEEQKKEAALGVTKVKRKQGQIRQAALKATEPIAFSMQTGNNAKTFILTGGALESPAAQVAPGVLSLVAGQLAYADVQPANEELGLLDSDKTQSRLQLANWIASPKNPLTARVIANRVWQWHFGTGLAANPNNFGKMGGQPSHPELLDYLASYLIEKNWSIKELHRLIMTSDTYARSSLPVDAKKTNEIDPNNRLLSHFSPRRLTAEELRDSMLMASGELNLEMGGLPVRPEMNLEVAMQPRHIMGSVAPAYQPSRTPAERNRRAIYAVKIRTLRNPMLEVFDQPGFDTSCERRDESTVTPQVFSLFNSVSSYDRALAMAIRINKEADEVEARIARAFVLAFGRKPSPKETLGTLVFVKNKIRHYREHPPKDVERPKVIVREMVEEMTGLTFKWEEQLDIYQNYVSDAKPSDHTAATHALADLCLVLLNANEFVYVY